MKKSKGIEGDRHARVSLGANARFSQGELVDQSDPVTFWFDNKKYTGFSGDTLASALLANGKYVLARSLKYHRPRGLIAAGFEEPNAIVQVGCAGRLEPNAVATRAEIYEGLVAHSVNRWPSLAVDIFAAVGLLGRFLPAGFYYKTFIGSQILWHKVFEPFLRRMAGFGRAPSVSDPENYDSRYLHCDVLVVGGGVAGIAAAEAMCRVGAHVVMAEDLPAIGVGYKNTEVLEWVSKSVKMLEQKATVLKRTTVFGSYNDNYYAAVQRLSDHLSPGSRGNIRQRLFFVRPKATILATGATERPLVFPNNDRPGIFLAGAARAYLDRYGVLVGEEIVLFTTNDSAYDDIFALRSAGAKLVCVVDVREEVSHSIRKRADEIDVSIHSGCVVWDVAGNSRVSSVKVGPLGGGSRKNIACDTLLVSGGWSPNLHLFAQQGGEMAFNSNIGAYGPVNVSGDIFCAGALCGAGGVGAAIKSGLSVATEVSHALGLGDVGVNATKITDGDAAKAIDLWSVPVDGKAAGKCFIDFQNDTTLADLALAIREGFTNPEHIKRYTLTGFGTDQGKLGNMNALGNIAIITKNNLANLSPTTYRPPFLPVTFGALAGRHIGPFLDPVRRTPLHDWHEGAGASFENVGQWKRPWYYPKEGETFESAVARECMAVRTNVGILDGSTLGKIEIVGRDAVKFLNRIYTNGWSSLAIGKIRYGILCREDGMIFDDGTTARLGPDRFLMTTTTGNAALVLDWLEEWLQTEWMDLQVFCTSVTDHWATIILTGPKAARVLGKISPTLDLNNQSFPFMTYQETVLGDIPARIFRISFTGELSYEVNIPWNLASHVWSVVMNAGEEFGITPYGTEAMHVLRAEKGYPIIGQDTDGTVTPIDLGMDWLVSKKKDFLGKRSLSRTDTARGDRKQMVGLQTTDPAFVIPEGAQLVRPEVMDGANGAENKVIPMEGHVTSSYFSPILGRSIALALLQNGSARHGETICAVADGIKMPAIIGSTVFYDPEGAKRDG